MLLHYVHSIHMCPCYSAIAIVCTKCERTRQIATSNVLIRNDSNSIHSKASLNTYSWRTITHGYNMYDPWNCLCIQTNPTKFSIPIWLVETIGWYIWWEINSTDYCVTIVNKHVMAMCWIVTNLICKSWLANHGLVDQ